MSMIILRQKQYNKKPTVYLLCGLPGSGKSTWCKNNYPDLPIVSRDIIRFKLGYTSKPDEKAVLDNKKENRVTEEEYKLMKKYLISGTDFIIDDTNLKIEYRKPLIDFLHKNGAYIIGVNFYTPLKVCIERRKYQIPKEAMINLSQSGNKLTKKEVDKIINVGG